MAVTAWNGEVLANSTKAGVQRDSAMAALPNGSFLPVWTDQDGDGHDIRPVVVHNDGLRHPSPPPADAVEAKPPLGTGRDDGARGWSRGGG